MLTLTSKPKGGEYVRLTFRARRFTGCTASRFVSYCNDKVKTGAYWYLATPAITAVNADVQGDRDLQLCDVIVLMALSGYSTTSYEKADTPTYDVILKPFRSFFALNCLGLDGESITLVNAEIVNGLKPSDGTGGAVALAGAETTASNTIREQQTAANGGDLAGKGFDAVKIAGYAVIAVVAAYALSKVAPFFKRG